MVGVGVSYVACIVGAALTYGHGPRLLYGAWSWSGGALFTVLLAHYAPRLRSRLRVRRAVRSRASRQRP